MVKQNIYLLEEKMEKLLSGILINFIFLFKMKSRKIVELPLNHFHMIFI